MPNSNFPGGFAQGVTIRGMPLLSAYPGKVFWVDSVNGGDGNSGTFDRPLGTIDTAVGLCVASRGDIIVAKAGHVETVTAAAGLALDVAGVAVLGLGNGALRPTINFTTATTATCAISAASCSMINILFTSGIDALVSPILISGADCTLQNIETRDNAATTQTVDWIVTTAGATRLLIDGWFNNGSATAGAASAIGIVGVTNPEIRNFKLVGNFSGAAIDFRTTASIDADIHDGYIWTKNSADLCIKDTVTGTTGKVGPNLNFMLTDNAANITEAVTGATFHQFQPIMVCNLAGEIGMNINTTASTDA